MGLPLLMLKGGEATVTQVVLPDVSCTRLCIAFRCDRIWSNVGLRADTNKGGARDE